MVGLVVFKRLEHGDDRVLHLVGGHVRALDEHALVRLPPEVLNHVLVVARHHANGAAVAPRDAESHQPCGSDIYHRCYLFLILFLLS